MEAEGKVDAMEVEAVAVATTKAEAVAVVDAEAVAVRCYFTCVACAATSRASRFGAERFECKMQ